MTSATREFLAPTTSRERRRLLPVVAVLIGLGGALVSFLGSWIPSYWGDEAASVMSAERPLATLWPELGRVDAVHGTYYLFLHLWIDLFGASELSVRLPSALAIGVAVAGVVVLAARLFSTRVAITAGIVMAVLPRTTVMGEEGRSYAIGTAIAVWLTVLMVHLVVTRSTRLLPWIVYGVGLALSIYVFLYLILLAGAHLIYLVVMRPQLGSTFRRMLGRWAGAVVLGIALSTPLLVFGLSQHNQISFLSHRHYMTFERLVVLQWFGNRPLALVGWLLVIVGIVLGLRRQTARGLAARGLAARGLAVRRQTVLIATWMLLPPLVLIAGNSLIAPMYSIRYLSFCTPAVAILVALAISAVPWTWARIAAVLAIVALAAPTWAAERGQYAKDGGSDLRQTAAVVAAHARPGDAIVFDETIRNSRKPRLALHLYPKDFTGLLDVGLITPYQRTAGLWDVVGPAPAADLVGVRTVWAVESSASLAPADIRHLQGLGYAVTHAFPVHRSTVYELTLETS
ncbi:glycosyltransferase family 39 protein [Lacisediminihabitans changchengi]|uniref:Glycosyltransferase family 39 protein n=1 Tax=Lacisediminihabitans changchengi TaxID=2787634 RepID=A0A934SJR8_9MICO|nr:glycosyltransferase family 39 protein [Lacisediminihabitans changchengi]MBK4346900.1 glycosyltransferase family 39 protein [Lacisediminihabitans changchengi]MBK4347977.1 glycosyltransferase family 39 protein [Lacisediminihabitans changchengi]